MTNLIANAHHKETKTMKKTLLVLCLSLVLVFAFSATAMAKITNGYISWDATGTNAAVPTPHKGYAVATDKCAVCHSVHNAAVAGTAWNGTGPSDPSTWTARSGEETQMLLRSSVANACIYCHITTNLGGVQLYGGNEVAWTTPGTISSLQENASHNRTSANCVNCHSVHGAVTYNGAASNKILKYDAAKIQVEAIGGADSLYATSAAARAGIVKDEQVTIFCTQCHANWSASSETTLNAAGNYLYGDAAYVDGDPTANKQYKSHPMKAVEAKFLAAGSTVASTTAVAFVGSETCRSCHDAGKTDEAIGSGGLGGVTDSNFPHYTAGAFNFVNVAASAAGATVPGNHDAGQDGMCLKCHINAAGDAGVGINF